MDKEWIKKKWQRKGTFSGPIFSINLTYLRINMVSFSEPSVSQTLDVRSIKHFRIVWISRGSEILKSNLLQIPDCRSFSVLKTLTGYWPYSHSENENAKTL